MSITTARTIFERKALACANAVDDFVCPPVENLDFEDDTSIYDKIYDISDKLFLSFKAKFAPGENSLDWLGVEQGYQVVGRGIADCYNAYTRFCQGNKHPFDPEDLVKALVNPHTIRFFTGIAKMPGTNAATYESVFNLHAFLQPQDEEFVYDPTNQCFSPNEKYVEEAKVVADELVGRTALIGVDDTIPQGCPAARYIPEIWKQTVDACQRAEILKEGESLNYTPLEIF